MIFYRGAGIGTYWHPGDNDPVRQGFIAADLQMAPTTDDMELQYQLKLMLHIARGTTNSPFISMTRSYGVAWHYAMSSSERAPTLSDPAYVHLIEIQEPLLSKLNLLDPVKKVARTLPDPRSPAPFYRPNKLLDLLMGIIGPKLPQPPGSEGTQCARDQTLKVETLLQSLRDAEILVHGIIPATCVRNSFQVYPHNFKIIFKTLDLAGRVPFTDSIELLGIELEYHEEHGPLFMGRVRYAINGVKQKEGFPLDLHKGAFVATVRIQEMGLEDKLQVVGPDIARIVYEDVAARRHALS